MSTQIVKCTCPDCQHDLDLIVQELFAGGTLILATCKNAQCPLFRTTLTPDDWSAQTPAQLESYREANRRNKWLSRVVAVQIS